MLVEVEVVEVEVAEEAGVAAGVLEQSKFAESFFSSGGFCAP